MVTTLASVDMQLPHADLAGLLWPQPTMMQTRTRINELVDRYVTVEYLRDRLDDLPHQLRQPKVRPWPVIDWNSIHTSHIIGLSPDTFLSILLGIINTELPIRGYSQTSRQYLESIHPGLAYFVGGKVRSDGTLLEKGLWEQEEQRHGPILLKVYRQLSGAAPTLKPHEPRAHNPSDDHYDDLYRHGMHRVATEYSATCLYLWLMAHTTGPLQQVFLELVKDEVNHMTKFWGFGVWLFPKGNGAKLIRRVIRSQLLSVFPRLSRQSASETTQVHLLITNPELELNLEEGDAKESVDMSFMARMLHTLQRMRGELAWDLWSWSHRLEFVYTFLRVMIRLNTWNRTLTPDYLRRLLGDVPIPRDMTQ